MSALANWGLIPLDGRQCRGVSPEGKGTRMYPTTSICPWLKTASRIIHFLALRPLFHVDSADCNNRKEPSAGSYRCLQWYPSLHTGAVSARGKWAGHWQHCYYSLLPRVSTCSCLDWALHKGTHKGVWWGGGSFSTLPQAVQLVPSHRFCERIFTSSNWPKCAVFACGGPSFASSLGAFHSSLGTPGGTWPWLVLHLCPGHSTRIWLPFSLSITLWCLWVSSNVSVHLFSNPLSGFLYILNFWLSQGIHLIKEIL